MELVTLYSPQLVYSFQGGLIDAYFIAWIIVQYYYIVFRCSDYSSSVPLAHSYMSLPLKCSYLIFFLPQCYSKNVSFFWVGGEIGWSVGKVSWKLKCSVGSYGPSTTSVGWKDPWTQGSRKPKSCGRCCLNDLLLTGSQALPWLQLG